MRKLVFITIAFAFHYVAIAQPEVPVEQWKNRTILLIAAHPDDDVYSMGTLAMLNANGNEVYEVILTTGNVGTHDPKLGTMDMARIRKQEEQDALKTLGIPAEHYFNLGYDDGMLEYENKKEVVEKLVRKIREIRPDVLFIFDPGKGSQRWHKADHRSASYLAADAARAAMWRLMFQGHITIDGLQAHEVREFVLFDSAEEDINMVVDISDWEETKVEAFSKYASQFGSGLYDYQGPDIPQEEIEQIKEMLRGWMPRVDGKAIEGFRYHKGSVEEIGR
ncbi:MAG: PIG-L family deacetylase [Bacteroidota bacterium]